MSIQPQRDAAGEPSDPPLAAPQARDRGRRLAGDALKRGGCVIHG